MLHIFWYPIQELLNLKTIILLQGIILWLQIYANMYLNQWSKDMVKRKLDHLKKHYILLNWATLYNAMPTEVGVHSPELCYITCKSQLVYVGNYSRNLSPFFPPICWDKAAKVAWQTSREDRGRRVFMLQWCSKSLSFIIICKNQK